MPSARRSTVTRSPRCFRSWRLLCLTGATARDTAHVANHADECSAVDARISLGCTLLIAAGAALHCIVFLEFGHWSLTRRAQSVERRAIAGRAFRAPRSALRPLSDHPIARCLSWRASLLSSPYSLIFLINVAREIPSSRAARVRL